MNDRARPAVRAAETERCSALEGDRRCDRPVPEDAPLHLCFHHLLVAHDFVTRSVGVTDALPSPCAACGSRLGARYPSAWLCAVCEWRVGDVPDGGSAPPRIDVVYYLRYRDRIKIGTSANPRQRLSGLLYDEVLAFEQGDRLLEQERHIRFQRYRIPRTEWFESHPELEAHIETVAAGVADPWSRYARWVSQHLALRG